MIKDLKVDEQAYFFAQLSELAYLKPTEARKIFADKGYQSGYITHHSSQAYVLWSNDDIIIVCRGTEATSFSDIKADLKFKQVNLIDSGIMTMRGEMVHAGFKQDSDYIWPIIYEHIKDLNRESKPNIWITGHSLGAAIATILALYVSRSCFSVHGLFTYGCPRIGNSKFVRGLTQEGIMPFRFVNSSDIVTRLPIFNYRHFGKPMYLTRNGKVLPDPSFSQIIFDRILGFFRSIKRGKISEFNDHFIKNYREKLYDWED